MLADDVPLDVDPHGHHGPACQQLRSTADGVRERHHHFIHFVVPGKSEPEIFRWIFVPRLCQLLLVVLVSTKPLPSKWTIMYYWRNVHTTAQEAMTVGLVPGSLCAFDPVGALQRPGVDTYASNGFKRCAQRVSESGSSLKTVWIFLWREAEKENDKALGLFCNRCRRVQSKGCIVVVVDEVVDQHGSKLAHRSREEFFFINDCSHRTMMTSSKYVVLGLKGQVPT